MKENDMHSSTFSALRNMSHVLHVGDVAEILSLLPITVQEYCEAKLMPHQRVGSNYRIHPRELAEWVDENPGMAQGSVNERIADWVWAHVIDRALGLPIPQRLDRVLTRLGGRWLASAQAEAATDSSATPHGPAFQDFQQELNLTVSRDEQCELFAELIWLGVYYA